MCICVFLCVSVCVFFKKVNSPYLKMLLISTNNINFVTYIYESTFALNYYNPKKYAFTILLNTTF